ncbi:DUF4202 domain-containing protein [Oceanospirillum beijerinckii]|uniref:DUF4202 domain-containing protein n=1 Tax=Oceanospirillum beijerinckii TaxID=64976 RepID=UPI0003FCADFA|nr:DUF4202 domain-containing protein [Oceanospirillum beijerinckii]MAC47838.1 DUF4202 domain-containing protein [Oceanospirillum sp.]
MSNTPSFQQVIELIDQVNSQDPNTEQWQGQSIPKELLYAQRMSAQLEKFAPQASELLQIAARAQHIQRWTIKRSDYPEGRMGYKHWRTELGKFHSEQTGKLMLEAGYTQSDAERVAFLLQKKQLKHDAEVQTLEDVICLVFLEYYLDAFAEKHNEEKIISIIQKTWKKMSEQGHAAALQIAYSDTMLALIKKALG